MRITPTTQTIANFFNNRTEQFYVPPYQRRYAWGNSQLEALFNDINMLKSGDSHLLGTVVLLTGIHKVGINPLELVDGQQRITTLCILLKTLYPVLEAKGHTDEASDIRKYLSCYSDTGTQNKLVLGDLDHNDFSKIMNDKIDESLENVKLLEAIHYFSSRISEPEFDVLSFYRKIADQTELIRLDIAEAKDAYKLFETINNRGLKLSSSDIVKNFLLGHASILGVDVLDEVKESWRQLILNLDTFGYSDMDKFFRQYLMGKIKLKIPLSKLTNEFKDYYYLNVTEAKLLSDYESRVSLLQGKKTKSASFDETNSDEGDVATEQVPQESESVGIIDFAKELNRCSRIYRSLLLASNKNKRIATRLSALKQIESLPAYTFLMHVEQLGIDDEEYIKVLELVESFILRRQVCEKRTGELDAFFSKLCRLPKENLAEGVRMSLAEELPDDTEFEQKFSTFNNKGSEDRAKYILSRIEYFLEGNTGEMTINGGQEVHLEHIIPQTIFGKKSKEENGGDWVSYLGDDERFVQEQHKKVLNKIGNLTILGEELNIKASNNPFDAKKDEYKKSMFKLNKELVKKYSDFKFDEVSKRGENLAKIAVQTWKF